MARLRVLAVDCLSPLTLRGLVAGMLSSATLVMLLNADPALSVPIDAASRGACGLLLRECLPILGQIDEHIACLAALVASPPPILGSFGNALFRSARHVLKYAALTDRFNADPATCLNWNR
jgi:hypothetical protein